jgi:hypothetical protein
VLRRETLSLIESELSKVRKLADRADEDVLCYLIDLAIAEVKSESRPVGDQETQHTPQPPQPSEGNVRGQRHINAV